MGRWYHSNRSKDVSNHVSSNAFSRRFPKVVSRTLKYLVLLALSVGVVLIHYHIGLITRSLPPRFTSTFGTTHAEPQATSDPKNATQTTHSAQSNLSTIAKVTASFGSHDPIYEPAISSHHPHNIMHRYPSFILREQMVRGLWSKHAYMLTIIGAELAKPESQRLKWLFWHDRDTILMNPNVPLEVFLPPEPEFAHINLLVTRDRNGLNNGVFLVRVNQWGLKMFASALSVREYEPGVVLKYSEQSAMEQVIKRVRYVKPS